MMFASPLIKGHFIRRYKRFLADVSLENGEVVTTHCPNPGAMQGLQEEGSQVYLSSSDNMKRKYPLTWELVEADCNGSPQWVGINSSKANTICHEALSQNIISQLAGYTHIRPEAPYGQNSRVDFLLSGENRAECYVEVKNCHLMRKPGLAEFPDSISIRAAKHMKELTNMKEQGARAVVLFIIQMKADHFTIARDIDPGYDQAFRNALASGVEAYAYTCEVSPESITIDKQVPILTSD